jgi:K+-sensing histidine kinase KdpD
MHNTCMTFSQSTMRVTRITVEPFEAAVATARDKVCVHTYTMSIVQAQSDNTAKHIASKQKQVLCLNKCMAHVHCVGWLALIAAALLLSYNLMHFLYLFLLAISRHYFCFSCFNHINLVVIQQEVQHAHYVGPH